GDKAPTLQRLTVDKNDGSVGLNARQQFCCQGRKFPLRLLRTSSNLAPHFLLREVKWHGTAR
ncbi:MAG: hypothetical protein ACK40X_01880, partial [Armatimonadota bacterium]